MVEPTRLSSGAMKNVDVLLECERLAEYAGDSACRDVLLGLCRHERSGDQATVWDIHRLTGLAPQDAFAALRTLEHGKILAIVDDPSDPFGATIRLCEGCIETLRHRAAA